MVDKIQSFGAAVPAQAAKRLRAAYRVGDPLPAVDSVQLSSDVMRLRGAEGVRFEKVMTIRGQMDADTYMTPEKLDVALDRVIDQLFP